MWSLASQLLTVTDPEGTAGHITSAAGYILANPGRATTEFTLVHIPPAAARTRYTRPATSR